jgi:hypothetical protein
VQRTARSSVAHSRSRSEAAWSRALGLLTLEAGVLFVDTGTTEDGPDHGSTQYLSPAKGPACIESA